MEELNPTVYYRAFCDIGWKWIFPVEARPFQDHKFHYLSAVQWCNDKGIMHIVGDMSRHITYVKCTTIMFTNEEDALAFKLSYGDLIISFTVEP